MQINIPPNLPKGKLIETLTKKVNEGNISLDIFGVLESFRKLVSDQVRHINELFPEYTPHDEYYHLKRLFIVTEVILGPDLLDEMSLVELFLLALSLYGHDWGMAVSNDERDRILGKNQLNFPLLNNEAEYFSLFLADNGFSKENFPHAVWQDYVRNTHALRSAVRIHKHFESIDQGVGEAVARICEGHWLDLKELTDNTIYPTNFSVLGELVNVKALAVYLRLIDLMDIGSDRTPYVVWKYVSPRNEFSKMEWEKHRALQPVASAPYQDGRILIIDGTTDNHNVYAALNDLKIYCDEQIKGCSNILAQLNDSIHKLNIYHAEWRINARNFKPISIQFEFDRLKMFEVLSDEIYKGDIHIFLRELLQNSVDAIKMRREILRQREIVASNVGNIKVEVTEHDNGDMDILFSDDGIGMDEYVIKNFLSVAGKSYYASREFQKLGLQMDPISRFGVGILSCFMVANEIEIETYKDPYSTFASEKLKIKIPSVNKQFRIEAQQTKNAKIGTSVLIKVLHAKVNAKGKTKIKVKEYLSRIAGFIDFPITIHEDRKKTVILSPYADFQTVRNFENLGFDIQQTNIEFPVEDALPAHSAITAKEVFRTESLDLKKDLKLDGIEGKVVFLVPANDGDKIYKNYYSRISVKRAQPVITDDILSSNRFWTFIESWKNSDYSSKIRLYINGILIEEGYKTLLQSSSYIFKTSKFHNRIFSSFFIINIPQCLNNRLDLSRTRILTPSFPIADTITKALELFFKNMIATKLESLSDMDLLLFMGKLGMLYGINAEVIVKFLDEGLLPVVIMQDGGNISLKKMQDFSNTGLYKGMPLVSNAILESIIENFILDNPESDICNSWRGGDVLTDQYFNETKGWNGHLLLGKNVNALLIAIVKSHFIPIGIEFVKPPVQYFPSMPRFVYEKRPHSTITDSEIISKIENNYFQLSQEEWRKITINFKSKFGFNIVPYFTIFLTPYDDFFAMGTRYLNVKHDISKYLFQLILKVNSLKEKNPKNGDFSLLWHLILELPFFSNNRAFTLRALNDVFYKTHILSLQYPELPESLSPKILREQDFIPRSLKLENGWLVDFYPINGKKLEFNEKTRFSASFGVPVTEL
jgi:hypothetical protein